MNKIINSIERYASWKVFLVLLLVGVLLATLIVTMFFGVLALNPEASMDSEFYYTSDTFFKYLDLQGELGRKSYLYLHLIDYLFIGFFYSLLSFTVFMLQKRIKYFQNDFGKHMILIPVGAAFCDLFENLCIDISISFYPTRIPVLANLSGYFTAAKMSLIYLTFIIIFALIFVVMIQKMRVLFNR